MSEHDTPLPTDEDAPPEDDGDEAQENEDLETLRGLVTDWQNEKGKGPARLKIAGIKAQVWPYEFGDEDRDEKSEVYSALKLAAVDDGAVEAVGEYKEQAPFYSEKAKKKITPPPVFQVYEADPIEKTAEMTKASEVAKKAVPAKGGSRGKGGSQYKGLTPEEWDAKEARKNQDIDAWAALKIVVPIIYARAKDAEPTIEKIEQGARALIAVKRRLAPDSLSSGSAPATASPSPTSEPEPSSAPAGEESAPSKPSRKRGKTSKAD